MQYSSLQSKLRDNKWFDNLTPFRIGQEELLKVTTEIAVYWNKNAVEIFWRYIFEIPWSIMNNE